MNDKFDGLARGIAQPVSRRAALNQLGAGSQAAQEVPALINLRKTVLGSAIMLMVVCLNARLLASEAYSLHLIGELNLGAYTREVRVIGGTAVVGADSQVAIIDVTDPTNPVLKGQVSTVLPEAPFGICLVSNLAYVIEAGSGSSGESFDTGYLEVIDFAVPTHPQVVGRLGLGGGAFAIAVSNQRAYVARRNWLSPSRLAGRLEVIDVSDPTELRVISGIDLSGDPTGIRLSGRYAYVAQELYSFDSGSWTGGYLDVVDVTDAQSPFSSGQMAFDKPLWGMDFMGSNLVLGGNIWIGGQTDSEITFLDVSQPTRPQILRKVHWDTFLGPIRVTGPKMWLSEQLAGKLTVLDPYSESLTRLASSDVVSGAVIFFDVQGAQAYAANYARGLQVFKLEGSLENQPPMVDASATRPLVISPNGTNATVILDGSRSSDPDGDVLHFTWYEAGSIIATGVTATAELSVGTHTIELVVSDGMVSTANSFTIEVITTAQAVSLLVSIVNSEVTKPRPLLATLTAAVASIERGNPIAAMNQLRAFQNQVQGQVARLDSAVAGSLIQLAGEIIEASLR